MEFIMSHHTATLQFASDKTAIAFDFACTLTGRFYWLDNHYVQPFYAWTAPHLREVAISGLYWALIMLIDVSLWLIDTTSQFMAPFFAELKVVPAGSVIVPVASSVAEDAPVGQNPINLPRP
jgi:hypothetical protein